MRNRVPTRDVVWDSLCCPGFRAIIALLHDGPLVGNQGVALAFSMHDFNHARHGLFRNRGAVDPLVAQRAIGLALNKGAMLLQFVSARAFALLGRMPLAVEA